MNAGRTSSTRRGTTLYELADDSASPWAALARRVLDDLEVRPHVLETILAADLTGPQAVVWCLYQPWSRKRFSFRAIAGATGTTTHNVEKHLARARAGMSAVEAVSEEDDPLDAAWGRWEALERLMASPPGCEVGDSGTLRKKDVRVGIRIDATGTRWPAEKWQLPLEDEPGYGPVTELPQDADADRDVFAKERRKAAKQRAKVDTSAPIDRRPVEARPSSRCPAGRRAHLNGLNKGEELEPGR